MRRLHDPAALAQGHRLMATARLLVVPAWIVGLLVIALLGLDYLSPVDIVEAGIALALLLGIGWLLRDQSETLVARISANRDVRLPSDVHHVLGLIDGLVDALERGEDRVFELDVAELGMVLDGLPHNDRRFFEERGADPVSLRHGVCPTEAKSGTRLSADRRRALHFELVRFATAARGQPCGDPYRSRVGDGGGLLGAFRDPALARTRRRYFVVLLLIGISWGVIWNSIAPLTGGTALPLCNPWADPTCPLNYGLELTAAMIALALVPIVALAAAFLARATAWRSWAAALPDAESDVALDDPEGSPLPALRRDRVRRRRIVRALVGLVLVCGMAVLAESDLQVGNNVTPVEGALVVGLVTASLVLIPAFVVRFERWAELRRVRARIRRVGMEHLSSDLSALRRALADAAPVRTELLEQLAETLADAESLGALPRADRDHVVERLRTASNRGPALSRAARDRLLLDIEICEALISAQEESRVRTG
jgi:hypothetical protein